MLFTIPLVSTPTAIAALRHQLLDILLVLARAVALLLLSVGALATYVARAVVGRQTALMTAETLRAFLDAFNAHDLDRIMSFFSDDCLFESPRGPDPWGTRFTGPMQVRQGLGERFAGIPDVHYGDDEHWVCGSHAVSRWLLTGTTTAGTRISVRGCDLFDVAEDGKIRRKDSYWKIVT